MSQLINKVAIVTGASSGIGKGIAIYLSSLGCNLAINGRNLSNLNQTKATCLEKNQNLFKKDPILIVPGDLTQEENCKHLIDQTVEHFGKIDILINSAGIIAKGTVENTSLKDYDYMMNVNVRSVFYLMHLAIPFLKKTKGNIVNISSVNGLRTFSGVAAYCISKSALDQLTRVAALELAADGVRVNSVNPGVIKTEIHKRGGMSEEEYQQFLERSKTTHPLGRPGEVDEVAKSVAFLATNEASSYITGVTLSIDGGRHLLCPR